MSTTAKILEDHAQRKDSHGVTWFDANDLARLGIDEPLMTTMQNVQHVLRSSRARCVVETLGRTDRFSVQDTR